MKGRNQMKRMLNRIMQAERAVGTVVFALAMLVLPIAAHAQTVTLFGALSNFDVLNDTGQDAHGFEIEMQGVPSTSVPYTFNATRYGASKTYATPNGVIVRWASPYDPVS